MRYRHGMTARALHLLAYDVCHPKRLRRALHVARRWASGGQKSAHECWLSEGERREAVRVLTSVLRPREDRLLILRLDPRLSPRCLGIARPPEAPGFRIIG